MEANVEFELWSSDVRVAIGSYDIVVGQFASPASPE